mmetsp:Transcript_8521/g.21404  ORF Transcript_8521/g.21404 Transcript_8521/m.21404 type:complete len:1044 (+) Transcript_8521:127-3258(+)
MDRDEVHHKMSKKIAQLTKVIFHLNTRNDEADLHLAAVTEAYEQEVEKILQDADAKVRLIAQTAQAATGGQIAKQIDALKVSFESEKREALREVQDLRSTVGTREAKNASMWSERITKMNSEVLALKQQSSSQVLQFKAALEKADEKHAAHVAELVEEHRSELEKQKLTMEAEFQCRYQEQEAREADARRSYEAELDVRSRSLSECDRRCQELECDLRDARQQLNDSLSGSQDALLRVREECDRLNSELQTTRNSLQESQQTALEDAARAKQALKERDDELESLKRMGQESLQARQELEQCYASSKRQVASLQEELNALRQEHQDLQRRSAADMGTQAAEALVEKQRLEQEIHALKEHEEALRSEIAAREAKETKLLNDYTDAKTQHMALEAQIVEVASGRDRLQEKLDSATELHAQALSLAQGEIGRLETIINELRLEVGQLQEKLREQAAEMQCRLQQLSSVGDDALDKERTAHIAALASLTKQHDEERATLISTHASEMNDLREELQTQLLELRARLATQESHRSTESEEHTRHANQLQEKLTQAEEQLCIVRLELEEASRRERALDDELVLLRKDVERLHEDGDRQRRKAADELQDERQRLERIAAMDAEQHRRDLEALREEAAASLAARNREAVEELERLRLEQARAGDVHGAEVQKLQSRIVELQVELKAARAEAQSEVERARNEGVDMVQRLSKEHQSALAELTAQQASQLENLRTVLGKSHQERIDEMRQRHAQEVDELKQKSSNQLREATVAHEVALHQLRSQHEAAVLRLVEEAREAADRHAAQFAKIASELQEAKQQLVEEMQKSQQCERMLKEAQSAVEELAEQVRILKKDHEQALLKKDDDFAREKRHLKEQHKTGVERLLQAQIQETVDLKEQFHRARHLQDMQLDMLQDRLKELQDLYDTRPPREEDLERIALLEEDVRHKEATVKRLMEEMQFYKLELHNREQNYNKVFGAQPTVGILNPVAAKRASVGNGAVAAPQMRLVQQPGAGMQMGLPPLGLPPAGPGLPGNTTKKLQKRPSSGNIRRSAVE